MSVTLGPASHSKERKYRRFDLQFPVSLVCPAGEVVQKIEGISENVSLGGLLVKTREELPLRTKVALIMELSGRNSQRPIRLSTEGEVVRVNRNEEKTGYAIAVKCTKLISEFRNQLRSAGTTSHSTAVR